MKTVCIDIGPATSPAPGTARFVQEQCSALLKLDVPWKWRLLSDSPDNLVFRSFSHLDRVVIPGRSRWRRAAFSLQRETKGADLVFGSAYFVPWWGPPSVANFFDSNIYEHFSTWVASGRLLNALLLRVLCDLCVLRARKLFVLSEYCAAYLRRRFPSAASKFVVIPPGCPAPASQPVGHRPTWAGNLDGPFLLYVGTFSENKNQRRLIEAYIQLQTLGRELPTLVVIGPCDDDFRNRFISTAISKSSNPAAIILPGRVSDEDLAWAYYNAASYIQPSIAEGFGLPVVEAMSYGLPVACSNTTSLPETAGGAALLFDPLSTGSIGGAIESMCFDVKLRGELKRLGDQRWREFTWQNNASQLATEIEKTLSGL